jgi:hypothetical protein
MRLSELLSADVVDEAGRSAGRVHDVRLVQDGPLIGGFGASLRLEGVIVGRRAFAARFGYERPNMRSPLPVRLVLRWLGRDSRWVDWSRVTAVEPGETARIRISGSVEDLRPPEPVR